MPNRIKFTKESIAALPLPAKGRVTVYDMLVPKLALRITAAGARTFYVIRRDGATMAWVKIGGLPDVSVEQARKAAQQVGLEYSREENSTAEKAPLEGKTLRSSIGGNSKPQKIVGPHGDFVWLRPRAGQETAGRAPAQPEGANRT
jgi:hypothetical protein